MLVAASTAVRTAFAFGRPTPLIYPDEYLYSTLARSIAKTGLPTVRGASAHFPALLGPYLMSPAWLIHDVEIAYRVALGWGSLWFSVAALPAHALAKRLGSNPAEALFVALVAVLVPDAAFTTTLLSEPFAYPVFLATMLVAVDAIAAPTARRQGLLLGLFAALCLLRLQFVAMPIAYVAAALACNRFSLRAFAREQAIVVGTVVLAVLGALAGGPQRIVGVYAGITTMHLPALSVARWFALDLFVLAAATGWVIVPGALAGLAGTLRSPDRRRRALAVLTLVLTTLLVGQAAFFGANEHRVHERYAFYVAPLFAIAFAWRDSSRNRSQLVKTVAYCSAVAAILLPLATGLRAATDDESPTLLGLGTLGGGGDRGTLVWASVLALLSVALGLGLLGRRLTALSALGLLAAVGAAGTIGFLGFGTALGWRLSFTTDVPRLHAPPGTALITRAGSNRFLLMKTLFWNPDITRVLVLGRGPAADGYAAEDVRFDNSGRLVDRHGRQVQGPFALDTSTAAATAGTAVTAPPAVFATAPSVFVFGWNRVDGYLQTSNRLLALCGRTDPFVVSLTLTSTHGVMTMGLDCGRGFANVRVGPRPVSLRLTVSPHSRRSCVLSLVRGTPLTVRGQTVSVRAASLAVEPVAKKR